MTETLMVCSKIALISGALFTLIPGLALAAVPHATCRTTDRPETGMSGETTAAERDGGQAMQGFTCNTDLVGQYQGEGASWQLTAWKNCAYFDQRHPGSPGSSGESHPGVVVLDVSDPTHPTPTTWLNASAMIDPWESVKVNPARQLLGAGQRPLNAASPGDGFSDYDISADCKAPVLKADVHLPGSFGHTGQWAPDGKTYYITPLRPSPSIIAVDVTDPTNPTEIPGGLITFSTDGGPNSLALSRLHDSEFTKDGNIAYFTMFGVPTGNGLAIVDVSDFQQRRANPQYKVVSQLTWDDGSLGAQEPLPFTSGGKSYLLFSDEGGGGAGACPQGKSANGFPRIIDVTNPQAPAVVSKLQLDVADPANCTAISTAPITGSALPDGGINAAPGVFAHSCHYCAVDDVDDAKIAACNCFAAGLRFFDITDVANPKEIAYFKAPAQGTKLLPSSQYANSNAPGFVRYYDWSTSQPSFPKSRGADGGDVWTTAQDNGFMVIRLYSAVTVSPTTATISAGNTATFAATVDGAAKTRGVKWAVQESSGGSVSDAGVFTGSSAGTYHVVATSILDPTKSAAATVTVNSSDNGGCSTTSGSLAGLLPLLALVGWTLSRRRASTGR
jgi:uncharacterized protein (TIGR03382 family)